MELEGAVSRRVKTGPGNPTATGRGVKNMPSSHLNYGELAIIDSK